MKLQEEGFTRTGVPFRLGWLVPSNDLVSAHLSASLLPGQYTSAVLRALHGSELKITCLLVRGKGAKSNPHSSEA